MLECSSERMEVVVDIYESVDAFNGNDPDPEGSETETQIYTNVSVLCPKNPQCVCGHSSLGGDTAWIRCYRVTTVCVVLLCVLLLTAITVLWINYHILITENNQLQTNYNNLTTERNQLQWEKKEILKFSKLGWIYFSLSLYYISTERKTWTESRENCRERGADLVIITSTEEQEFINKLPNYRRAWIGLSNRENKWKWVDDTTLITGLWGDTEPNGGAFENCVVTGDKTDPVMNWADYPCNRQHNWICEKRIFN